MFQIRILSLICCLLGLTACVTSSSLSKGLTNGSGKVLTDSQPVSYSKDTLIIFFDKTVGNKHLLEAINKINAEVIYHYTMMNGVAIKLVDNSNLEQSMTYFRQIKGVLSVERDSISTIR